LMPMVLLAASKNWIALEDKQLEPMSDERNTTLKDF
jgi:hypothetical protein